MRLARPDLLLTGGICLKFDLTGNVGLRQFRSRETGRVDCELSLGLDRVRIGLHFAGVSDKTDDPYRDGKPWDERSQELAIPSVIELIRVTRLRLTA